MTRTTKASGSTSNSSGGYKSPAQLQLTANSQSRPKTFVNGVEVKDGQIPVTPTSNPAASPSIIGQSYNQMVGEPDSNFSKYAGMLPNTSQFTELPGKDGFYSSMSGLEGASMRLANAASQRSMAEAGYGSGLKMGETAVEYGLRGGLLDKEYGLKGGMLGQEYGLRGDLAQRESDIQTRSTAQGAGYLSPSEMQFDIRRRRQEQDRKTREQDALQKKAQTKLSKILR